MAKTLAPTKGNLMMAKNTLRLSKQGYEMLDKKRNILIREMMLLKSRRKSKKPLPLHIRLWNRQT
jgi:vacuolar-type H+-ATPase subunit D/Vma8